MGAMQLGSGAGLRRRFKTVGGETGLRLHSTAPLLVLLTVMAIVVFTSKSSLSSDSLFGLKAGAWTSQAGATAAEETQQQGPFATVADQQEATWRSWADGPETEGLPCRESGYCSVGKLQPYVGEVDSFEGFKAALNGSCYKKECIHISIGTRGHLLGVNFVTRAWQLGLANVMIIGSDNASCATITNVYKNISCVWTSRDWLAQYKGSKFVVGEVTEVWAIRYILLARAVWLGYNVFLLDSDTYMFHDPFRFLKQLPFANISFISLQDGGAQLNGGSSYIHNAAPGGPTWWTIAAVAERLIFVKTQWSWFMENHGLEDWQALGHAMMDQPVLSDIIAWQYLGHPTLDFTQIHSKPIKSEPRRVHLDYSPKYHLTYPPEWKDVALKTDDVTTGHNLTIPFQNGTWPEIGIGPRFPERGNYTLEFIKLLEEESGYKYYDAYGSPPPGFVMPPNETWIFMPQWILGAFLGRGLSGYWELGGFPPTQVMVHLIYIPGALGTGKEYILKAHNGWTYEASLGLEGKVFPCSTPEQQLPRVLALPRDMRLAATSAQDFRDKSAQLVKLALRLNRVLYMPEPICKEESWISPKASINHPPNLTDPKTGKVHSKTIPHIGRMLVYGLDPDLHCIWWPYVDKDCMSSYIIHTDYKELVKRLPPAASEFSPDNTVQLEAGATLQQALEAAAQKDAPQVLFLSGMPDFAAPLPDGEGEADKRFQEWSQACKWMKEVPKLLD